MTDNEVIVLFRENLMEGLNSSPYTEAPYGFAENDPLVQQSYQPKQQGVPSKRGIYFNKIYTRPYGFPGRNDKWQPSGQLMEHTEIHWYESSFQFLALAPQDPANTKSITAHDILVAAKQVIYSDRMRLSLRDAGIGNYRISEIRTPYFMDDYDRFESAPSFDVTFTYKNIVTTKGNVVESVKTGVYPV